MARSNKKKAKKQSNQPFFEEPKINFNPLRWVLILIRAFIMACSLLFNAMVRFCIVPLVPILPVKRYIESLVNLVSMWIILLCLGFFRFTYENFKFFNRDYNTKIKLKSGFVGIATHKSIVDFIFYSYLFNPIFVRVIIMKNKNQNFYAPLSFKEALYCALDSRGFQPIIVQDAKQFKKIKYRKLALETLISQNFQEFKGPIMVLLPGLKQNEFIAMNNELAVDIHKNETSFERSGVGLHIRIQDEDGQWPIYKNQAYLLLELMSEMSIKSLSVSALQFRKMKTRYDKWTYAQFINQYYKENQLNVRNISYEDYVKEIDLIQKVG